MSKIQPTRPCDHLEGLAVPGGWTVEKRLTRTSGLTGSQHSSAYAIGRDTDDGPQKAFLKAIDFSAADTAEDPAKEMQRLTGLFEAERALAKLCADIGCRRVVKFISEGVTEVVLQGRSHRVQYLIFELALGDVRQILNSSGEFTNEVKFNILADVAIGLSELHKPPARAFHQDIKPSNVLIVDSKSNAKVGDLGHAVCAAIPTPRSVEGFSSDPVYMPPECLYGYVVGEEFERRGAIDCYHLGNLAYFLFTGSSLTEALFRHVPHNLTPGNCKYSDAVPVLRSILSSLLYDFAHSLPRRGELISVIVQLCEPAPERRGHPKSISRRERNYNMTRYVSLFRRLARVSQGKG